MNSSRSTKTTCRNSNIMRFNGFLPLLLLASFLMGCKPASRAASPAPAPVTPTAVAPIVSPSPSNSQTTLPLPPAGQLYHASYPGGVTGEESDITLNDLRAYEAAAGKRAVWVYFSHNWYEGRAFPLETAAWIRTAGSIPYTRLMLRSDSEQGVAEPLFNLQNILDGQFDDDFRNWCASARDFGTPLLAEYGTEVNGEWFSWNGVWNGAGKTGGYGDPSEPDGPERFRDAYRRIIQICRDAGADNITWVFHLNAENWPAEDWNAFENYYPGDEWIDWLGVSLYGAQTPQDEYWEEFRSGMDAAYPRVAALTADKPIFIAEFGVTDNNPRGDQAAWARAALTDITAFRWPRIMGFSWWNEQWRNDDHPAHDTTMRLQDNSTLASVFQELVGNNSTVLGQFNLAGEPASNPVAGWWQPAAGLSWQWQIGNDAIDTAIEAAVYDIDLYVDQAIIDELHAKGRKVICYISVGSYEDWRPDADQFPPAVLGKDYAGWPGEKWLDIRRIDLLAPIMLARLDACAAKGFDGVEPDNMEIYTNNTGFPITYEDQLRYALWLADAAHQRGLAIGQKNASDQVANLVDIYDFAITEDYFYYNEAEAMLPYIKAGKPVFAAEYTDLPGDFAAFCKKSKQFNFSIILKNRGLDAWLQTCP